MAGPGHRRGGRRDPRRRRIYLRRRLVLLVGLGAVTATLVIWLESPGRRSPPHAAARARSAGHRPGPSRSRPSLPLAELAGQRVIYAYSGLTPPPSLLAAIRAGEAAGVILFGPNVSSPAQIRAVMAELQRANAAGPIHAPLLILTDQEGGEIRRLPGGPALSEREIGQSADPISAAAGAGAAAARDLTAAGVNVNLAPVLDVLRRPDDFIDQFGRSYGGDSELVGRLAGAFITAQQSGGVAATAKHFPGLGAAARGQDTDSRPVTLRVRLSELRGVDEAPYRRAIAAGVKLVMASWAVYPALDPSRPAGLSGPVIEGELRHRLGFGGVVTTDTLSAAALARYGTLPQRALLAARAGADLLICSAIDGNDDPSGGLSVLRALMAAIAHGQLERSAAEESAARVLALRSSLAATG